jgi:6-phosphogluconolactonase
VGDTERVLRFPGPAELADCAADAVLDVLQNAQSGHRVPHVVLTGGSIARTLHGSIADAAERGAVDWGHVHVWWGDERFVPADDGERNAGQAWEDMLRHLPVDTRRVHEMAASDGEYADVDSAASAYAHELRRAVEARGPGEPWFDVLMLGIGPDGHCASLFPGRPEVGSSSYVVGVTEAPKPPPLRISLTMGSLRRARHVIFIAAGAEKAGAVARSVAGQDVTGTPAAGPRGLESTTWFIDDAAAHDL